MTSSSWYALLAKRTAQFRAKYQALACAARAELTRGDVDTGTPDA